MAIVKVACRYCQKTDNVVKRGLSSSDKQRYQCRSCRRYFQLDYIYNACKPGVRDQIIDMTINSSGISDISRVLKISAETVLSTLKKTVSEPGKSFIEANRGDYFTG